MTKVYVVTSGSYSDYQIEAIFSTQEKAQSFIDKEESLPNYNDIEEWELDIPESEWITTFVNMTKNGTVTDISQQKLSSFEGFVWMYDFNFRWAVKTDDKERAVKVTNEKRTLILALNIWGQDDKIRKMVK